MLFDKNRFPCLCEKESKKAYGFQILHFYWSFLGDMTMKRVKFLTAGGGVKMLKCALNMVLSFDILRTSLCALTDTCFNFLLTLSLLTGMLLGLLFFMPSSVFSLRCVNVSSSADGTKTSSITIQTETL